MLVAPFLDLFQSPCKDLCKNCRIRGEAIGELATALVQLQGDIEGVNPSVGLKLDVVERVASVGVHSLKHVETGNHLRLVCGPVGYDLLHSLIAENVPKVVEYVKVASVLEWWAVAVDGSNPAFGSLEERNQDLTENKNKVVFSSEHLCNGRHGEELDRKQDNGEFRCAIDNQESASNLEVVISESDGYRQKSELDRVG